MIPKMGIDQANRSLSSKLQKVTGDMRGNVDTAYRVYVSAHNTNERALETARNTAQRARDSRDNDARNSYKQASNTPGERGSWEAYDTAKITNQQLQEQENTHSKETFDNAEVRAEEDYRQTRNKILSHFKEAVTIEVDAFTEAHP